MVVIIWLKERQLLLGISLSYILAITCVPTLLVLMCWKWQLKMWKVIDRSMIISEKSLSCCAAKKIYLICDINSEFNYQMWLWLDKAHL